MEMLHYVLGQKEPSITPIGRCFGFFMEEEEEGKMFCINPNRFYFSISATEVKKKIKKSVISTALI